MTIKPVNRDEVSASVASKLAAVEKKVGFVPNLISTLAHSEVALDAYLSLSGGVEKGELSGAMRERLALITAEHNGCEYCDAAHTYLAKQRRVPDAEIAAKGRSADTKTDLLVQFAQESLANRGRVGNDLLQRVRAAGYSDGQLLEVVANLTLNVLTNFSNNLAGTKIDFPAVELNVPKAVNS